MRRESQTRHHRPGSLTRGRTRRSGFGLRAALLATLAQVVVSVVHQLPHEHRLSRDVAAVEHQAGDAHHGHHEHGPSAPASQPDTTLCVVGQMLQHMAAVLPVAGAGMVPPDWDRRPTNLPRDTEAAVVRLDSPAQPRAPPRTA